MTPHLRSILARLPTITKSSHVTGPFVGRRPFHPPACCVYIPGDHDGLIQVSIIVTREATEYAENLLQAPDNPGERCRLVILPSNSLVSRTHTCAFILSMRHNIGFLWEESVHNSGISSPTLAAWSVAYTYIAYLWRRSRVGSTMWGLSILIRSFYTLSDFPGELITQ